MSLVTSSFYLSLSQISASHWYNLFAILVDEREKNEQGTLVEVSAKLKIGNALFLSLSLFFGCPHLVSAK